MTRGSRASVVCSLALRALPLRSTDEIPDPLFRKPKSSVLGALLPLWGCTIIVTARLAVPRARNGVENVRVLMLISI